MAPACPHCGSFDFGLTPDERDFFCLRCERSFEVPDDRYPDEEPEE